MTQRAYRAACPNCGAPVDFASAASSSAVCSFCRSTLVRDGEALRRIGVSAELFDDHTPLQLGAAGMRLGLGFTLVGRLQYGYSMAPLAPAAPAPPPEGAGSTGGAGSTLGGTWNEWHALFDNGRGAWLSEDNGAYVLAFDAPLPADAPALDTLRAGQRVLADGRAWDVASVVRARLIAAQGELPAPPRLEGEFLVVDLRNSAGEVATLDASDRAAVHWSVGRSVAISELAMSGLREAGEKALASRALECPSCGASLQVTLATTQSIACNECKAVVDLSGGVGAELAHYRQNDSGVGGLQPQIALGNSGTLALGGGPLPWQVVGYLERCDIPTDADEDTSFWREYLLYNRQAGFAFLVDSDDGWSWVRPITGVPVQRGPLATWEGAGYHRTASYGAKVTWVLGEFYWRVQRDERAEVADYEGIGAHAARRLSREESGSEITWSAGETIAAAAVADAFGIAPGARAALQRDTAPVSAGKTASGKAMMIFGLVVLVMLVLGECSGDDCDDMRATFGEASNEYRQCIASAGTGPRTSGGSYGGWASGGGHK